MEPAGSLPHSQVPPTCPYPKPHQSSPCPSNLFLKIHLNIILPSAPGPSKWSGSFRFPTKTLHTPLLSPIRAKCPHFIRLDLNTWIMFGEEYRSFSTSLRNLLHSPVTSSLSGPNILLNTLFSNTLRLTSSPHANDQVSHRYKKKNRQITVLYV